MRRDSDSVERRWSSSLIDVDVCEMPSLTLHASRSAPDLVAQLYECDLNGTRQPQWPRTPERTPSPEPRYQTHASTTSVDERFPVSPVSPVSEDDTVKFSPSSPESGTSPLPPQPPFSLFDHLKEEVLAHDLDGARELKSERIANFLAVPMAIEQVHRRSIDRVGEESR
jgi:hypothetical protein